MLTEKRKRFIAEYMLDLNGAAAAVRAGYSAKTARFTAHQLLGFVEIQAALEKAMLERSQRTQVTADDVLRELARLAFSDPRQVMTWGPAGLRLVPSSELTDDAAAAIAEVSQTPAGLRVKLHSKPAALEQLGRHLGMFRDRLEVTDGGPSITLYLPSNGRDDPKA